MRKWGLFVSILAVLALGVPMLAGADAPPPPTGAYANSDPFTSWPGAVLLHVERNPPEAGYVRSDPYYLDCPNDCTRPFDPGQKVTLWAYPSNGPHFTGWSGDLCAGQGNPCVATMSKDSIVTANFEGDVVPTLAGRFTLTVVEVVGFLSGVTITPPGSDCNGFFLGPVTCTYRFAAGTNVSLVFGSIGGPGVGTWSGDCSGNSAGPCDVTMNRNRSVTVS